MNIRCPHCHNPVNIVRSDALAEVKCQSCGSFLNLVDDDDKTAARAKYQTIAQFELIEKLGMGQFGSVWKARDTSLDRFVAIKVPRLSSLDEQEAEWFLREGRAAAQLSHPGIVSIYEVGKENDRLFIASQLIEGTDLKSFLETRRLTPHEATTLMSKIADAVHAAHEAGVTHRDLKPSNILMDAHGEPHIADFGLAKRDSGEVTMTIQGQLLGTPAYMSPEQARGEAHRADARSDVWALGVIFYELLTGELPFRGDKRMLLMQIVSDDPTSPRKLTQISRNLETICLKCMRKDSERRYSSAAELAKDLRRELNNEPIKARPVGFVEQVGMWCRRRPAVAKLTAAIAVLMFVATGVILVQGEINRRQRAKEIVAGLLQAESSQVAAIIDKLSACRSYASKHLRLAFEESPADSNAKLHAALALLPQNKSVLPFLEDRLLTVSADQFRHVADLMIDHRASLTPSYWVVAKNDSNASKRFQAACALASFDTENEHWKNEEFRKVLARHLVGVMPSQLSSWRTALRPVKYHLIGQLTTIFAGDQETVQARGFAADTLADYNSADADALFNLLAQANAEQFRLLFDKLIKHRSRAVALGIAEVSKIKAVETNEETKEMLARRKANAAVMLLRMDTHEKVWPLLAHRGDNRTRSYLIHWIRPRGGKSTPLIAQYQKESNVSIKRALLLCLGDFDLTSIQKASLIKVLLREYRNGFDAGLHSTVEWVVRRWGQAEEIAAIDKELSKTEQQLPLFLRGGQRQWYLNSQGQTFVILNAGKVFMGQPGSKKDRSSSDKRHQRSVDRRIAIATKEVTRAQWRTFSDSTNVWRADQEELKAFARSDDSPMIAMTWYEAAHYCNWLSEQEGIPQDQWCYVQNKQGRYGPGMKAKDGFLELTGYRLPTEAEWEYACRAGSNTVRFYGVSKSLLTRYAWYQTNSDDHTHPVGRLKPNDFGLFDMHGNVLEWCYDVYQPYSANAVDALQDRPPARVVVDKDRRVLRGGAYLTHSGSVLTAFRFDHLPVIRRGSLGFRPARTYNLAP